MPVLKVISGHTSCAGPMRYLTKGGRALAVDFINIDAPAGERERAAFDWAAVMDATRRSYGNDTPWGGLPCRTYKHYILSPDPKDGISLDDLRCLATEWAKAAFGSHEVAIVYHDNNEGCVPHAHVVVNNTNIDTGRRLQDPRPKELNHLLQKLAAQRNLRDFDTAKGGRTQGKTNKPRPKSMQPEYLRRAEAEIAGRGGYSWVADIRARVALARAVSGSEAEFKALLSLYWYAPAGSAKGAGPKGLPIARRRDGFSFVLADRTDLPHVNIATLDGQVVLMRVAGELVDCARFGYVSRLADSFVAQERSAYRYLATAAGDDVSEDALCEAMGMTPETERRISQLYDQLYGE